MDTLLETLIKAIETYKKGCNLTYGEKIAISRLRDELIIKQRLEKWENLPSKTSSKVQIGCGTRYLDEFVNIDIQPPADILCDVRDGIPLPTGCFDFVFSEHFIEHLDYPVSVDKFMSECYRILNDGGKIVIGAPDTTIPIEGYVQRNMTYFKERKERLITKRDAVIDSYIDILNYHVRDEFYHRQYSPHYWAYDSEKLCNMLIRYGFKEVGQWKVDIEIVNLKRLNRTVYVSGIK